MKEEEDTISIPIGLIIEGALAALLIGMGIYLLML